MNFFKNIQRSGILFTVFLWIFILPAKANPTSQNHEQILFNCTQDRLEKYLCINIPDPSPDIILSLPRLERKKISRFVNAFRIMPSITNLTKNTIVLAKVRLRFISMSDLAHDFIIQQKIIPNGESHTKLSYLIRSDVPVQAALYDELLSTVQNGSYRKLILELLEVKYVEQIKYSK